ncbi:hypothetical protein MNO14_11710 [Luteimonas sp. S4-F44]|uniref:hypothetical protein n=1 Tax=Luteimonas sp. S4-F44 TaxID=2925842 RepID=UPI001F52E3F0|nr:hypothetical protein [Luteimonas sp. S4-F44]UNK41624.1 hypothetical protein MNO14_11710 [Luteimonas sp. S4-F44]
MRWPSNGISPSRIGVLRKCQLPPPAWVQAYALTAWGYEAEPIFQVLGRWAVRSPLHDPTRPLSAVSTMLSLRTMLRPDRAPLTMTVAFRFPGSAFVGRLSAAGLAIERGDSDAVDVAFETETTTTFVGLVYGGLSFDEAEAAGALRLIGDRGIAARFIGCFALPDKIEADTA